MELGIKFEVWSVEFGQKEKSNVKDRLMDVIIIDAKITRTFIKSNKALSVIKSHKLQQLIILREEKNGICDG